MADGIERATKFQDAALVLVDDARDGVSKLGKLIRTRQYQKAEALAGSLQRAARDAKWLLRRLPRD
jgi:hypothetical protein